MRLWCATLVGAFGEDLRFYFGVRLWWGAFGKDLRFWCAICMCDLGGKILVCDLGVRFVCAISVVKFWCAILVCDLYVRSW